MTTRAIDEHRASGRFVQACDAHGRPIDLAPIRALLDRIVATWKPERIWLFGSRARGDGQPASDWDLFAVVPEDVSDDQIGPVASWRLKKESRARAEILACRASEFREDRDTPNTIVYDVAREGVLLYER